MPRLRLIAPALLVATALLAPTAPAGALGAAPRPAGSQQPTAQVRDLSRLDPRLTARLRLEPVTRHDLAAAATAVPVGESTTVRLVGRAAHRWYVVDIAPAGSATTYALTVLDLRLRPTRRGAVTATTGPGGTSYSGRGPDGSPLSGTLPGVRADCDAIFALLGILVCDNWIFCPPTEYAGAVICTIPTSTAPADTIALFTDLKARCSDIDCTATTNFLLTTVPGAHPRGEYISGRAAWAYFYGNQPLDYTTGTGTAIDTNPPLIDSGTTLYFDAIAYDQGMWTFTDRCFPRASVILTATFLDGREELFVTTAGTTTVGPTVNCPE
jgi:hypothetical protein